MTNQIQNPNDKKKYDLEERTAIKKKINNLDFELWAWFEIWILSFGFLKFQKYVIIS